MCNIMCLNKARKQLTSILSMWIQENWRPSVFNMVCGPLIGNMKVPVLSHVETIGNINLFGDIFLSEWPVLAPEIKSQDHLISPLLPPTKIKLRASLARSHFII